MRNVMGPVSEEALPQSPQGSPHSQHWLRKHYITGRQTCKDFCEDSNRVEKDEHTTAEQHNEMLSMVRHSQQHKERSRFARSRGCCPPAPATALLLC